MLGVSNSPKIIKSLNKNNKAKKKEYEKDIIIARQQNELISLSKEIINLTNKINDLKVIISSKKNVENEIEKAEIYIKELEKKNKDISIQSKEKENVLKQKINKMITEKEKERIKLEQDSIVYNQKMSVINYIEMENKVFQDEVKDLKEKQKNLEIKAKENIQKMEIENILKYRKLKEKMMESLNETKDNVSKLKIENFDINGKITSLQNYQLLQELENYSQENRELIKENKELKKQIYDLRKELDIHKRVEIDLTKKFKTLQNSFHENNKSKTFYNNKNMSHSLTYFPKGENNTNNIFNNYSKNSSLDYKIRDKLRKVLIENSYNKYGTFDFSNNNNTDRNKKSNINNNPFINTKDSEVNLNNSNFGKGSYSTNYFFPSMKRNKSEFLQDSYYYYDKYIKNKKEEIEKLKFINETLKQKLYKYENKYNGLFTFLEESLEKFFKNVENKIQEKGVEKVVYIDIEKIKKFDFSCFNDKEKYNLLILIMNYLLPLVTLNFNSNCNLKKDLFCTNLNIIDRKFNKNKTYLADKYLRKAFLNKNYKLKADLYVDNSRNNMFSNSIPILRKNKSLYEKLI